MAKEFGIDPYQIRRSWTWRQLRAALDWMEADLERPSKTEQYLMQIAMETHRVALAVLVGAGAKGINLSQPKLQDFKLRFGKVEKPQPMSDEMVEKVMVATLMARTGMIPGFEGSPTIGRPGAAKAAHERLIAGADPEKRKRIEEMIARERAKQGIKK